MTMEIQPLDLDCMEPAEMSPEVFVVDVHLSTHSCCWTVFSWALLFFASKAKILDYEGNAGRATMLSDGSRKAE
jgi:hypothetical protein